MAAGALPSALDVVRTSTLALAAVQFWRANQTARLTLGVGMAAEAVEAIEALRDLAETGPVEIRARSAATLPAFLSALTALAQDITR